MNSFSLTGRRWVYSESDDRLTQALAQRFALPDVAARIMASRGITLDEAADFLEPTLRALLPDPLHLKDMNQAVARVVAAIHKPEKICVFGDYDVDGATSAALLIRFFRALGIHLQSYIPDRSKEGYGPNVAAMQKLAGEGVKLLVTVDCGTTAHEPLEAAQALGMDTIILDHHVAEPRLPPAIAMINPNRLDETSTHRQVAAVGVTFLFLVALNAKLREEGFYKNTPEPDLRNNLDLVALGTVADVVSLTGLNRAFVCQGLKVLGTTQNLGLQALLKSSRATGPYDTYTLGFLLGPRVNAGGRVGKSDLGTRLLSTENAEEVAQLAATLEVLNEERRGLEATAVAEAIAMVPHDVKAAVTMVQAEHWHPGVIGLVASRLKDRFNRPALVTAFAGEVGKGSCRSIKGMDIGNIMIAARQEGLLVNGGGHAMAAGFTVSRGAYAAFSAFVEARVARVLASTPLEPTLQLDGMLTVGAATLDLAKKLQLLAPFGAGNPEPRFALMDAKFIRADVMGEKHLRLMLGDEHGSVLRGVCWRAMDNALGEALLSLKRGARLNVAGTLRINNYAMRDELQLVVEDVMPDAR